MHRRNQGSKSGFRKLDAAAVVQQYARSIRILLLDTCDTCVHVELEAVHEEEEEDETSS